MHAIRLRQPWPAHWCASGSNLPSVTSPSGSHLPSVTSPSGSHLPSATADQLSNSHPADTGTPYRTACYRRSFNCPTGLQPEQSVLLVMRDVESQNRRGASGHVGGQIECVAITLNSELLPTVATEGRIVAEIGERLEPFNRLEILCQVPESSEVQPPVLTDHMEIVIEIA